MTCRGCLEVFSQAGALHVEQGVGGVGGELGLAVGDGFGDQGAQERGRDSANPQASGVALSGMNAQATVRPGFRALQGWRGRGSRPEIAVNTRGAVRATA
jgi:hypothetical protein